MLADFGSTLHAALANIEKFGSLRLGGFANWRMLIIPAPQRCQLGRHHGALAFVEMSAPEVERDHVGNGIVACVDRECRLDASREAGAVTIATVEDPVFIDDNWLVQSMLA